MTWFLSKALWRPSKCGVSQINCFCSTDSISISNTNIEVQKFNITNLQSISNTKLNINRNLILPTPYKFWTQNSKCQNTNLKSVSTINTNPIYHLQPSHQINLHQNAKKASYWILGHWCTYDNFWRRVPGCLLNVAKFWLVLFKSLYWKKSFKLLSEKQEIETHKYTSDRTWKRLIIFDSNTFVLKEKVCFS